MPRIKVDSSTTLEELQRFAGTAAPDAKIRARRHADGSFTLYASTKRSFGIKNFLFGRRAERRAAAREAVTGVLTSVRGARLDRAMADVLAALPREGELRGNALAGILQGAADARRAAATPRSIGEIARSLQDALEPAAGAGRSDELQALATELGDRLAKQMRRLDRDGQLDAVMSRGDGVKDRVLRELAGELDRPGRLAGSYRAADPAVKAFLDAVYDHAMLNLADRRLDDDRVIIDGTTYSRVGQLAKSGFGTIDLYRAEDGTQIVIKTPTREPGAAPAGKFDEAADELSAHRSALAGDPANVVGLKGALRTPEGMLQIALEYAPGGDAERLIGKVATALERGEITPEQAKLVRLTLLKDMVAGVRHVQQEAGLVHLDVKAPNFFVAAGGVVKLGDFGTAAKGEVREIYRSPIDNPRWASPELAAGSRAAQRRIGEATRGHRAAQRAALAKVNQLKGVLSDDELAALKKDIRASYAAEIRHDVGTFAVTGKTDTWSLGVDAYRMFVGRFPFEDPGGSDVRTEDLVLAYREDDGRIGVPDDAEVGMDDQDRQQLDELLRGMLHPDPKQRPSLDGVLDNPLLRRPGVGGAEARRLIEELAG